jgi:patatin-like phospholipase/acyl hydrolase
MDEVRRLEEANPFADPSRAGVPIRPCDYFDLICGTSTGGLIALMLGRMEYVCPERRYAWTCKLTNIKTVEQAIEKYKELSEAGFTSKSTDSTNKYNHETLENCIKRVISQ